MVKLIEKAIEDTVENFRRNALQMDDQSSQRQIRAETPGVLRHEILAN